ncbi:MAG: PilZ domain-containing protein [Planctomycetota bacterium]|jgi:hypothetical protein
MTTAGEILKHQRTSDTADAPFPTERRRHARLKQRSLHSNIGPVIDLSRAGMRVTSTRRLRGMIDVVLFNPSGAQLQLRARVVWSKRLSFRKHVSGLEFIDPAEHVARELAKIGTTGFFGL